MSTTIFHLKLSPALVDNAGRIVRVRWILRDAEGAPIAAGTQATKEEAQEAAIAAGLAHATAAEDAPNPGAAALDAERDARAAIDKARGAP